MKLKARFTPRLSRHNFGHRIKVEQSFYLLQFEKNPHLNFFWNSFGNCYATLIYNLRKIMKVGFYFFPHILCAFKNESQHLWFNTIICVYEHERGILTHWNQRVKITFLFYPNLISNLEKMKIFNLKVKISLHIYLASHPFTLTWHHWPIQVFIPLVLNLRV